MCPESHKLMISASKLILLVLCALFVLISFIAELDITVQFQPFADANVGFLQRKAHADKQNPPKPRNPPKASKNTDLIMEMNEPNSLEHEEDNTQNVDPQQKLKRLKRPKRSVNENLEQSLDATAAAPVPSPHEFPLQYNNLNTLEYEAATAEEHPSHNNSSAG